MNMPYVEVDDAAGEIPAKGLVEYPAEEAQEASWDRREPHGRTSRNEERVLLFLTGHEGFVSRGR